jgi:hypothetical protein
MPEVELHESADEEFKAAITFYESRQAGLGDAFLKRVSEGFELIKAQHSPVKFCPRPSDAIWFHNFLISIVYRFESDRILVLAVAHWNRRPDFWKART